MLSGDSSGRDVPPPVPRAHVFDALIERAAALPRPVVAVAAPLTRVALEGSLLGAERGLLIPLLVGPERTIRQVARDAHLDLGDTRIIDAPDEASAAARCAAVCRSGDAGGIMKGSLHTALIM